MADDAYRDFSVEQFERRGASRRVLRSGTGPAVVVISEIPGITPAVLHLARRVRDLGCTVVLPELLGVTGRDPNPDAHGRLGTVTTLARAAAQVCVSREFTLLATNRTSPAVPWLRELAAAEHERCGGPGVGVVGLCLTGGFALAMATDESVIAPVLAEPSLPVGLTRARRHSIDISPDDLAVVQQRCAAGLSVLGLRFAGDRLSPPGRFAHLSRVLGDAFVAVTLPDESANPDSFMAPHSVLTEHLVDEPGEPTHDALEQVLELFRSRLLAQP